MIFLIEYYRKEGKIIKIKQFNDSEQQKAEKERLEMELNLNQDGIIHEVVLLQAENKTSLHKTHQRYFATVGGIVTSTGTALSS